MDCKEEKRTEVRFNHPFFYTITQSEDKSQPIEIFGTSGATVDCFVVGNAPPLIINEFRLEIEFFLSSKEFFLLFFIILNF